MSFATGFAVPTRITKTKTTGISPFFAGTMSQNSQNMLSNERHPTQLYYAMDPAGSTPTAVYEAVVPPTETLLGMGLIISLCIVVAFVWSNEVVPVSRTKLAISKSRGEVKEYLDELRSSDPRLIEATTTNSTISTEQQQQMIVGEEDNSPVAAPGLSSDRALERWLFTDWLLDNKSERKAGRQKEPAIPILKDAKWNSGDNPVVVASLLMLIGLLLTAATEQISSLL